MSKERKILDSDAVKRAMTRIAHEVVERNKGVESVVLVGIRKGGEPFARRLAQLLTEIEGRPVPRGFMDVTMYRDDIFHLKTHPKVHKTEIDFDIEGKVVVMVDDVLFTGRTIRAALDALMDFGRPRSIQLAVLVDRGHRELPIRADFVGRNLPTARGDRVKVKFGEGAEEDQVVLIEAEENAAEPAGNEGGK
jgi:pyrimidine operon attenuation protein/uracil phosphoribosyltransferase